MACATRTSLDLGLRFDVQAIQALVEQAAAALHRKYGDPLSAGRNRVVYFSKSAVFKLPRNDAGMLDNSREARLYREHRQMLPMAACRLVHLHDIPVLVMTRVDTRVPYSEMPDWASSVDCQQVGRTRDGRFLAYDYA